MNPQEVIGLIETIGPLGVDLYLKLRAIFQLGPDEQKNIHDKVEDAIAVDEDTKAKIAAWKQANGFSS